MPTRFQLQCIIINRDWRWAIAGRRREQVCQFIINSLTVSSKRARTVGVAIGPVAAGCQRKVSNLVKFYAVLSIYLLFHTPAGAPGITGLRTVSSSRCRNTGECTKLERARSSTPKRSKLTPHFRKRIFCCSCAPRPFSLVCARRLIHIWGCIRRTRVYMLEDRSWKDDRLWQRYSLAWQGL